MAEIRKHVPKTSTIGDLVRAAAGETVRPVTPGEPAERPQNRPSNFDPFVDETHDGAVQHQPIQPTASSASSGGWFTFNAFERIKSPEADED